MTNAANLNVRTVTAYRVAKLLKAHVRQPLGTFWAESPAAAVVAAFRQHGPCAVRVTGPDGRRVY